MRIGNLKAVNPKVFKFDEGQNWDGDEAIFYYIEKLLGVDEWVGNIPKIKQKTYITIQCAKEIKSKQKKQRGKRK